MGREVIIFLLGMILMLIVVSICIYKMLTKKSLNKIKIAPIKEMNKDKKYEIKDKNSANAKLFGFDNGDDDLDKTQVFSKITEDELFKYYDIDNQIFNVKDDMPKLKN